MDDIELSVIFAAAPGRLYEAWLDAETHAAMTGGAATGDPWVGGEFTAWDGYISGRTLDLEPGVRIVQAWRTAEFPDDAPDSRLELLFEDEGDGARLTLRHTEIPAGQGERYLQGWRDHYFDPMTAWIEAL